jgi:uncharacterized repeat protein (TIGR03803 family)
MQRSYSPAILAVIAVFAVALALVSSTWAATETILYDFRSLGDGAAPIAGVLLLNGRLYGTTAGGGLNQQGTVYELRPTKSGWTKNTLYEFTGGGDGADPWAGLVADKEGNLYGAASSGGLAHDGVIYEMQRKKRGWRYVVIHTFTGPDGAAPVVALTWDRKGNLYGATAGGGAYPCNGAGCGTVFELSPSQGRWALTTLYNFTGGSDGWFPMSPLYRGHKGNFYGTAETGGGSGCNGGGCGTVYELSSSGSGWKFAVIHRFTGPDGIGPTGRLAMDKEGSVYGTTANVAKNGFWGVVYRLMPGGRVWKETVLHEFSGSPDGLGPNGGVVIGLEGGMYGTTVEGGELNYGSVFEIKHSDGRWKESVPFSFNGSDGFEPVAALVPDGKRGFWGTAVRGGTGSCSGGCGLVFRIVP